MQKKSAIFDGNYFLMRFAFSPSVRSGREVAQQFLGVLWDLRYLGSPTVVFDGRRPEFRMQILPDYKKKAFKETTPEEKARAEQVATFRDEGRTYLLELLPRAGVPILQHPDFEADDQVNRLAEHLLSLGHKVTAVTSDSDYFQMCSKGVLVHRPYHDETIDSILFYKKFGFEVEFYPLYLSLCGSHNAVPGIPSIGPVRATQIIKQLHKPTVEGLRAWASADDSKLAEKVRGNIPLVKKNLYLIDLNLAPLSVEEIKILWDKAVIKARPDPAALLDSLKRTKVRAVKWVPFVSEKSKQYSMERT